MASLKVNLVLAGLFCCLILGQQLHLAKCQVDETLAEMDEVAKESSTEVDETPKESLTERDEVTKEELAKREEEAKKSFAEELKRAKQICNDNKKVPVESISDMSRLIALISSIDQSCKQRYLSAIYELDPILKLDKKSYCEDSSFELMKDYHFRFIQPFKRANRQPTQFEPMPRDLVKEQLHPEPRKYTVEFDEHSQVLFAPIAVRHFFLKFALQVSFECKKNLLANFKEDLDRLLTDQDREVLQMFERDSPIGQALAGGIEKMDFDSVLHIPELDGKLKKASTGEVLQAEGREQHLKTSASENSALYQMLFACKNRFKPLYDKLIMPIVKLSKLGYDYQGKEGFSEREQQFLTGDQMKTWLVVVHVCEIFKNTHLIRTPIVSSAEEVGQIDNANAKSEDTPAELAAEPGVLEAETLPEVESEGPTAEAGVELTTLDQKVKSEEEKMKEEEEADLKAALESKEGKLEVVSEEEAKEAEMMAEDSVFKPINYEPSVLNSLEDKLMIQGERQLDLELSRKHGSNPFGFLGFLRRASSYLKSLIAKLDLERFAHYRRHSLFYSGLLNFLSGCSNVASISMTITSLVATG